MQPRSSTRSPWHRAARFSPPPHGSHGTGRQRSRAAPQPRRRRGVEARPRDAVREREHGGGRDSLCSEREADGSYVCSSHRPADGNSNHRGRPEAPHRGRPPPAASVAFSLWSRYPSPSLAHSARADASPPDSGKPAAGKGQRDGLQSRWAARPGQRCNHRTTDQFGFRAREKGFPRLLQDDRVEFFRTEIRTWTDRCERVREGSSDSLRNYRRQIVTQDSHGFPTSAPGYPAVTGDTAVFSPCPHPLRHALPSLHALYYLLFHSRLYGSRETIY